MKPSFISSNTMNLERNVIDKVRQQNSSYTSPESASNQANSLESLSTDIYTDSKRFIYELLQNADDASNKSGKLEVQIAFEGKYVIISHQGEPFSEVDIESVCSVGDGNKKGDENKTGFKGIGFKSVFSHSDYVHIHTGNYSFRFDKDEWNTHWCESWGNQASWESRRVVKGKDGRVKMPWQIIPIWTELAEDLSFVKGYNVSTIIRYENTGKLKNDLSELLSDTQILLFLRSNEVKITVQGEEPLIIEKVKENGVIQLKRNGKDQSEWLTKSFVFAVDIETKRLIENDIRIPKKLRTANSTEISFAVQLEKGKIKPADEENRLIFTYLPTSVNYNFPFLVNASFLTDAGRQHLHEDLYWNVWLFKQIPLKFFTWLAELAETPYKGQILRLVPHTFSNTSPIKASFDEGFRDAVKSIAFLPNHDGNLIKVFDAIYDRTNISSFLNKGILIEYLNKEKGKALSVDSFVPYLDPFSTMSRLGVEIFDIDDLEDFFVSDSFKKNHQLDENFRLISFLYQQTERSGKGDYKSDWNQKLRSIAFIYDEDQQLKSPQFIYFPSAEPLDDFSNEISIMQKEVFEQVNQDEKIKRWLEFLGVKEPSSLAFIEKTIIEDEDFVTKDNVLLVGKYLFNAHKRGLLDDTHYERLKKVKILTKRGGLLSAGRSYLSNYYDPELKIEPVNTYDIFTSDSYLEGKALKSEWKTFFIKIGVNENISLQKFMLNRTSDVIESGYFDEVCAEAKQQAINADYYAYKIGDYNYVSFDRIAFTELAKDYDFAKLFWKMAFDNVNISQANDKASLHWGYYGSSWSVKNYFQWSLENSKIFPTTKGNCLKASEVYINRSEIREIAGKYLPVFDYEGVIPSQWTNYLQFKQSLGLNEYLSVLSFIWQDSPEGKEEREENKNRISLTYEKITNDFLGNIGTLKEWGETNKLLAKDGKSFCYPSDLYVVTVDGFRASNLAYVDKPSKEVVELLRMFGVAIIDNVTPHISNSKTEITDLKKQLHRILPLVAAVSVEKSKSKKDWALEYDKLKKKLNDIRFFKTTEIYLSYGNEDDRQKRTSWAKDDDFYYVGEWYSPRILDGLVEPLCKFLGIWYAERLLIVLLLETFSNGVEYLKEKFGEEIIDIIPDELLNTKEPEISKPNATNRAYNHSDEDLGNKGELFVFEELKRIYSTKYNANVEETTTGFKISTFVEVHWKNISENTTANHDFRVVEKGKEIFIDSKATPYDEKVEKLPFFVSPNEFALMEKAERYLIARVYNVTTNPSMKLIRLKIDSLIEGENYHQEKDLYAL